MPLYDVEAFEIVKRVYTVDAPTEKLAKQYLATSLERIRCKAGHTLPHKSEMPIRVEIGKVTPC